jgi:hypothetical protein
LFQSDEVNPFVLFQDILLLFKNFLKKKYLIHIESIYFGYDFQQVTKTLNVHDRVDVQNRCKNFRIIILQTPSK